MTRKHYVEIAKLLNRLEKYDKALIHKHALIAGLCDIFDKDNPSFDRDKFWTACGEKGGI